MEAASASPTRRLRSCFSALRGSRPQSRCPGAPLLQAGAQPRGAVPNALGGPPGRIDLRHPHSPDRHERHRLRQRSVGSRRGRQNHLRGMELVCFIAGQLVATLQGAAFGKRHPRNATLWPYIFPALDRNRRGRTRFGTLQVHSIRVQRRFARRFEAGACTSAPTRHSKTLLGCSIPGPGLDNYYGRFYKSVMPLTLRRFEEDLLRRGTTEAQTIQVPRSQSHLLLGNIAQRESTLRTLAFGPCGRRLALWSPDWWRRSSPVLRAAQGATRRADSPNSPARTPAVLPFRLDQ